MPTFEAIGVIRTPFAEPKGTPIQPVFAAESRGTVILDDAYAGALEDLEGFELIWLIYHWHQAAGYRERVTPFRDTREHGLFATRAPTRPNPIGMSAVRLLSRDGCKLEVEGIDVVDGTPLLDVKPYVPGFDAHPGARAGWFDEAEEERRVADGRFD